MKKQIAPSYEHVLAFALEHPWAVVPSMRPVLANVLARRLAGVPTDPDTIAEALEARSARDRQLRHEPLTAGGVRVIAVGGILAPKVNLLSDMSGGATFEGLTQQLRAAVADPAVKAVVFDVDSPGGNVAGANEFARELRDAKTVKPIFAQARHLMASAAYWAMSGATQIVASPSSLVGAIGVYALFDDITEALKQLGIKREVFSAGKYKSEGVGGVGLSDEARAHLQHLVDVSYGRFVGDVASGRGVPAASVRNGFGQGRTLDADAARAAGLIDAIGTIDETLARASVGQTALSAHRHQLAQAALAAHRQQLALAARSRRMQ